VNVGGSRPVKVTVIEVEAATSAMLLIVQTFEAIGELIAEPVVRTVSSEVVATAKVVPQPLLMVITIWPPAGM